VTHLQRLARRLRITVPAREELAGHPLLRRIARRVLAPALWRTHHEAVARGVAIGLFWAFFLPCPQIIVSAAHCVWWRGNIPIATGLTLITNPLTTGFWLWAAYLVGSRIVDAPPPASQGEDAPLMQLLVSIGWPAMLGMGIFSVVGGVGGYFGVKLGWRMRIAWKRRGRR
jgi:uncharacterized protein (DUF2062 family)